MFEIKKRFSHLRWKYGSPAILSKPVRLRKGSEATHTSQAYIAWLQEKLCIETYTQYEGICALLRCSYDIEIRYNVGILNVLDSIV